MIIRRAALDHAKYRDQFGIVGVQLNTESKILDVIFAYNWNRKDMNIIPNEIQQMQKQVKWDILYTNQLVGEHLFKEIKRNTKLKIITTEKNLKDSEAIDDIEKMDKFEQVQMTLKLFQNNQITLPKQQSKYMQELIEQLQRFTEKKTDLGVQDYYGPGIEPDSMVKALLITIFSLRNYFIAYHVPTRAYQPTPRKHQWYIKRPSVLNNKIPF